MYRLFGRLHRITKDLIWRYSETKEACNIKFSINTNGLVYKTICNQLLKESLPKRSLTSYFLYPVRYRPENIYRFDFGDLFGFLGKKKTKECAGKKGGGAKGKEKKIKKQPCKQKEKKSTKSKCKKDLKKACLKKKKKTCKEPPKKEKKSSCGKKEESGKKKESSCGKKKESSKKKSACSKKKASSKKKDSSCGKKKKKEDTCSKKKKKEDTCGSSKKKKKEDSCESSKKKKKEDSCGSSKKKKKEDSCGSSKKKESSKKKGSQCGKKKESSKKKGSQCGKKKESKCGKKKESSKKKGSKCGKKKDSSKKKGSKCGKKKESKSGKKKESKCGKKKESSCGKKKKKDTCKDKMVPVESPLVGKVSVLLGLLFPASNIINQIFTYWSKNRQSWSAVLGSTKVGSNMLDQADQEKKLSYIFELNEGQIVFLSSKLVSDMSYQDDQLAGKEDSKKEVLDKKDVKDNLPLDVTRPCENPKTLLSWAYEALLINHKFPFIAKRSRDLYNYLNELMRKVDGSRQIDPCADLLLNDLLDNKTINIETGVIQKTELGICNNDESNRLELNNQNDSIVYYAPPTEEDEYYRKLLRECKEEYKQPESPKDEVKFPCMFQRECYHERISPVDNALLSEEKKEFPFKQKEEKCYIDELRKKAHNDRAEDPCTKKL